MGFRELSGWRLFGVAAVIVAGFGLGVPALQAFDIESLRWGIRFTARSSVILFLAAFVASAAFRLAPNAGTAWLRGNRRYFGLSFAFSHLVHAGLIIAYAAQGPEHYAAAVTPGMIGAGAVGYTFILLMAATSFPAPARWIGPRNWALLHIVGVHWLWVQFVIAFGKRVGDGGPIYWIFLATLAGALALRILAWRLSPRRQSA